jgi:predicted nucleic-acid-binding protein
MRSADASLLVGSLAGNGAAQAFIREEGPVWVSHLVLAETVRALECVHGRSRPRMAEALEMILDNKDLVMEDPAVPRAALEGYRSGLEFEDAMTLETARKAGHLPLGTLRVELRGIPGTVDPGA